MSGHEIEASSNTSRPTGQQQQHDQHDSSRCQTLSHMVCPVSVAHTPHAGSQVLPPASHQPALAHAHKPRPRACIAQPRLRAFVEHNGHAHIRVNVRTTTCKWRASSDVCVREKEAGRLCTATNVVQSEHAHGFIHPLWVAESSQCLCGWCVCACASEAVDADRWCGISVEPGAGSEPRE